MFANPRFLKSTSLLVLLVLLIQLIPVDLFSSTTGPKQPEFTSFSPLTPDGFVNEFNGSFNWLCSGIGISGNSRSK